MPALVVFDESILRGSLAGGPGLRPGRRRVGNDPT
jgi:hypothetical protein